MFKCKCQKATGNKVNMFKFLKNPKNTELISLYKINLIYSQKYSSSYHRLLGDSFHNKIIELINK